MADTARLTPELLGQLLRYDRETGKLFWRERDVGWFASLGSCKSWNTRYANQEALTTIYGNYRRGAVLGHSITAHRAAFVMAFGRWPSDQVDHIDGDFLNNRPENLRDVSAQENQRNATRRVDNKSGVPGVSQRTASGKYTAMIKDKGRTIYLGTFAKFEDAVAARKAAESRLGCLPGHGREKPAGRRAEGVAHA